jgi:PKD repeat protein
VNVDNVEGCVADGDIAVDATIPNGTSYAWSGGNSIITATNTFDQMGTYNVTATDAFGCVSTDQLNVSFIDVPVANITETHLGGVFFFSSATSINAGANATYFWDFGDGNTSTEANPIHAYIWSGVTETYNVSLSITNSCGEDPTSTTISYNVLSAENASKGELKVYPIPAQNLVTIEFGEVVAAAEWQILDLAGRSVLNGAITSVDRTLLDVSSLSAGSYILKVNGEGVINVASLIIE